MELSDHTAQITAMLRSHVERCLQQIWETHELVTDDDGDYPFRSMTAAAWVCVVDVEPVPCVRVFAHAARGIPRSARMLTEINHLNARARTARVVWLDGLVLVDEVIPWMSVSRDTLQLALGSVTTVADDIGPLLATVYGGTTPFALDTADHDAA